MKRTLALVLALSLPAPVASACAALGPDGPVAIEGEEALIVWDEEHETEHFIRRAFFKDAPADFGFLVPTPTNPEIAEAASDVFERLYARYHKPEPHLKDADLDGPRSAAAAVTVVQEKRVGGLDATVIQTTSVPALDAWLTKNHYPNGFILRTWLKTYVERGWYITAFKIASNHARGLTSTAVRLSFSTARPFFPYSEPANGMRATRPFRLSLIASGKLAAGFGAAAWDAKVGYAQPLPLAAAHKLLDGSLPPKSIRAGSHRAR